MEFKLISKLTISIKALLIQFFLKANSNRSLKNHFLLPVDMKTSVFNWGGGGTGWGRVIADHFIIICTQMCICIYTYIYIYSFVYSKYDITKMFNVKIKKARSTWILKNVYSTCSWYDVMKMSLTTGVFLPKTHNPNLIMRKILHTFQKKGILQYSWTILLKIVKFIKNKSKKLLQPRGT